jgi:hypothetical protein
VFGFFKKKQPTVMDGLVKLASNSHVPKTTANLDDAIRLADQTLLQQRIALTSVVEKAKQLFNGPMPYSTHDLAVATALGYLKDPELLQTLRDVQSNARNEVARWQREGRLIPMLAETFEAVLESRYASNSGKPETNSPDTNQFSKAIEHFVEGHKGATPQQASKSVGDFMVWQHSLATGRKLDHDDLDAEDHEAADANDKTIERAYMVGASRAAIHAFSLSADDHYFWLNVISVYHGWSDKDAIYEEILSMDDASKANEEHPTQGWFRCYNI